VDNNKYLRRNVRAAGINFKNTRKTLSFSDAANNKDRAVKMSLLMGENVEMRRPKDLPVKLSNANGNSWNFMKI
jgi:hypothetical protein